MIESGSHTLGVRSADFRLPSGTALRMERPAEPLCGILSSYSVLDSDASAWPEAENWMLPSWARLWIGINRGPVDVAVGRNPANRLGQAMLVGVTSRAMAASTSGGVSVVIDIGPVAWARLIASSAEAMRDRMVPLDQMVPAGWSEDLVACIAASDCGVQVKAAIDDFFLQRMPPPHPHEALIAKIAALLVDDNVHDLKDAAARVGIDDRTLVRLSKRYFGFPPKILSMRTRFIRVLTAMMLADDDPDYATIPAGYHDVSHFIRDANRFLGLTPRRFLAIEMPYSRATLRARSLVMGAATASIDKVIVEL